MNNYSDFPDWVDAAIASGEQDAAFVTREIGPYRRLYEAGYAAREAVELVQRMRQWMLKGATLACSGGAVVGVASFGLVASCWDEYGGTTAMQMVSVVMLALGSLSMWWGIRLVGKVRDCVERLEHGKGLRRGDG